ncbi:hypothetical protein DCO58_08865 [Helicobacter saguini]|uniref:ABC transporter substrate-binding protein n=1 Tax=Helicobacter saguini TaxID=1548018 RepID=A0A347VNZ8_9HELI|nr:MetQ/NlpA family ABC transporter substrate-binding protein [Helicobacter saguini]MWV61568.1 hypothetical protein [Helicobacter saguini]MWV67761.1 hypothetical protein [Helicobacter saguini]MWV70771.1 hypothetical protein [Helicobacter saguini]MWV72675.1 hypothetical protein [Helicobacter saguini]TLD94522.1 ABC transporter substrate-binding protein [Helicobacter saguini]
MLKVLKNVSFAFAIVMSVLNAGDLKVGATPVPHAKILEVIKPDLKNEGINLKIVEFSDYVMPNLALEDKSLDANFMQHLPYLQKINKDKNLHLVSIAQIHVEPIGVYSKKIKNINDLHNKAVIAIPADPSNGARALILLHNAGIIELKDPKNLTATKFDIKSNPKKLEFKTLEAGLLTKTLPDVDAAIINGNFAMQAGLSAKDALLLEDARSPYANILVVRKGDENRPDILALKKALQSEKVKKFIEDTYQGSVVPAF